MASCLLLSSVLLASKPGAINVHVFRLHVFVPFFFLSTRKDGVVVVDAGTGHGNIRQTEPSLRELTSLYPGVRPPDGSDRLEISRHLNILLSVSVAISSPGCQQHRVECFLPPPPPRSWGLVMAFIRELAGFRP